MSQLYIPPLRLASWLLECDYQAGRHVGSPCVARLGTEGKAIRCAGRYRSDIYRPRMLRRLL